MLCRFLGLIWNYMERGVQDTSIIHLPENFFLTALNVFVNW